MFDSWKVKKKKKKLVNMIIRKEKDKKKNCKSIFLLRKLMEKLRKEKLN